MNYKHEDGTPFTKEEFLQKLKTDKEFNDEFGNKGIDQISELIRLLQETPDSRRMVVNAWAVHDLPNMVLPPCHYGFQIYTRELSEKERMNTLVQNEQRLIYKEVQSFKNVRKKKIKDCLNERNVPTRAISLMWNQRSVDTPLGLPFNIASYGLLLLMIADEVNMVPEELIGNLGDTHIYVNQIDGIKEQIGRDYTKEERLKLLKEAMGEQVFEKVYNETVPFGGGMSEFFESYKIPKRTREPYPLPTVHVRDGIYCSSIEDVILENYKCHPKIEIPLSN